MISINDVIKLAPKVKKVQLHREPWASKNYIEIEFQNGYMCPWVTVEGHIMCQKILITNLDSNESIYTIVGLETDEVLTKDEKEYQKNFMEKENIKS